jgi:hypothetical protein
MMLRVSKYDICSYNSKKNLVSIIHELYIFGCESFISYKLLHFHRLNNVYVVYFACNTAILLPDKTATLYN